MMDRAGFLQSSPPLTRSHHRQTTATTIVTSPSCNNINTRSSIAGKTGSKATSRVTVTQISGIDACHGAGGDGGGKAALIKAVQQQQHNSIGFRVNPRSPVRVNAMRERERRHLDSLNYWKREFAVVDTAATGGDGAGGKKSTAQCNGIDSHNSSPALARHVGVRTRSDASKSHAQPQVAQAAKVPPFPVIGAGGAKQRYTTKDKVISFHQQQQREEEFAKKLSPIHNSPQFFNHQLADANRPLSPLKSPPPPTQRAPVTLWSQCNMMAATAHQNHFTHHKSAFYTPTAVRCGGVGAGYYGAGYGCHQAAAGHYVWMGPMGGAHHQSAAYYHPVRAVQLPVGTNAPTTTVGETDEEEGENAQPDDSTAAGVGGKVDEDEELIFAIEI